MENIDQADKMDKNIERATKTKALCFVFRERIEECVQNFKLSHYTNCIATLYRNHPGLFLTSLIAIASVLIPMTVIISIIAVHVVIGVIVFIVFEATILFSSAVILSFVFLFIIGALLITGVSFLAVYFGINWFLSTLKNMGNTFLRDLLQC